MKTPIVLTVIADDHPGIINIVSQVLYKYGGTWTESSMASLAGQFAGILLATVPADQADQCIESLQELTEQGLHVVAHIGQKQATEGRETREYVLDLVGNDRRGIVHDITTLLARHDVNVLNLKTVVESAAMGGGEVFKVSARLIVPVSTDIDVLESRLEEIANELMVDIRLKH